MRQEFRQQIMRLVPDSVMSGLVLGAIANEYEFSCPSFVYAGPGHQSRHDCDNNRPHEIEGEHYDSLYEWKGTSEWYTEEAEWEPRDTGVEDIRLDPGDTWVSVDGYTWRLAPEGSDHIFEVRPPGKRKLRNAEHRGDGSCGH